MIVNMPSPNYRGNLVKKIVVVAFWLCLLVAGPARAVAEDFSFTGNFATDDDVQFFDFSVGETSDVTLRTWSYAGGTNAAGVVIPAGGFDPILALFDSAGVLIGQNDDGFDDEFGEFGIPLVPEDPVTGAAFDTFLSLTLSPGDYTVSVMQFSNFAIGPTLGDGFEGSRTIGFVDDDGNIRTSFWAFDILNVEEAVVIPEPSSVLLAAIGLIGLVGCGWRRRKQRAA